MLKNIRSFLQTDDFLISLFRAAAMKNHFSSSEDRRWRKHGFPPFQRFLVFSSSLVENKKMFFHNQSRPIEVWPKRKQSLL